MEIKNKKSFPKFKKKLKGFVTDESWKISKRDALWLSAGAVFLWWVEQAVANTCIHSNSFSGWATRYGAWWSVTSVWAPFSWVNTAHVSWNVNWHFSRTPNWGGYFWYTAWSNYTTLWWAQASFTWHWNSVAHSNHANHASHASHASSWSWDDSWSWDSGDY